MLRIYDLHHGTLLFPSMEHALQSPLPKPEKWIPLFKPHVKEKRTYLHGEGLMAMLMCKTDVYSNKKLYIKFKRSMV